MDIKISQKHFSDRVDFVFKDDGFEYHIKDPSGERRSFVSYLDIDLVPTDHIKRRNEYFRNLGLAWVFLGCILLFFRAGASPMGWFWVGLGVASLCVHKFFVTEYLLFKAADRNIYVMKGSKEQQIRECMRLGYKTKMLQLYGSINYQNTLEEEEQKFRTLHKRGIMDAADLETTLETMQETRNKFKDGLHPIGF